MERHLLIMDGQQECLKGSLLYAGCYMAKSEEASVAHIAGRWLDHEEKRKLEG